MSKLVGEERRQVRKRAERRFRLLGLGAVTLGVSAVLFLLLTVFTSGFSAYFRTVVELQVSFDPQTLGLGPDPSAEEILKANYFLLAKRSFERLFPEGLERRERRNLGKMLSKGARWELRDLLLSQPELLGESLTVKLPLSSDVDQVHKGNAPKVLETGNAVLSAEQLDFYESLLSEGRIKTEFNFGFLQSGDSRAPELAGLAGAVLGSFWTLIVCFLLSFPLGIAAAVYLEEFSPKNRVSEFIEVNINNLAAVPSIIFGLLGLAVILNVFGIPRGTPFAGGIVLALMTLPTIIIACRSSLRAVPPSVREAAAALGASPVQVVLHHVLPLALPGTLTGTIIGLAQALGETAPLLMIGMVAFVVDLPSSPGSTATVLPVQIYLWAESAERGFVEKTSAAIMLILVFLIIMNSLAVFLRKKFERRW